MTNFDFNQSALNTYNSWMAFANSDKYFGKKPDIPPLVFKSLSESQNQAVGNNLSALPGIQKLVGATNEANMQEWVKALSNFLPRSTQQQIQENFGSMVRGEIPLDVQAKVQNNAAATALGGGYAGGGMHRNLVARDLGLTSLDLTTKGQGLAQSWAQFATPTPMRAESMFVSPTQQYEANYNETLEKWKRDLLAAGVEAAPDPEFVGKWTSFGNALKNQADIVQEIFRMIYGGGGMGGGGGGGGGGFSSFMGGGGMGGGGGGGGGGMNFAQGSEMMKMFQGMGK